MDDESAPAPRDAAAPATTPAQPPPPQSFGGPPAFLQPPRGFVWMVLGVPWVLLCLWYSNSVGSNLLFLTTRGLALLLSLGWVAGRVLDVLAFVRRRRAGEADPTADGRMRRGLMLPLTMVAMYAVIDTRALLMLRVKLSESALIDAAAHGAGLTEMNAYVPPDRVGHFWVGEVWSLREEPTDLGVALNIGDYDFLSMRTGCLLLAAEGAHPDEAERARYRQFRHLFGRWWTWSYTF